MSTASICITKCIPGVTRNAEKLQQSGNCIWVIWRNQTLITSSVTTDPNRRCFEVVFEMDKHEGIWSTTWKLTLKVILQSVEADPAFLSLLLHSALFPKSPASNHPLIRPQDTNHWSCCGRALVLVIYQTIFNAINKCTMHKCRATKNSHKFNIAIKFINLLQGFHHLV